MRGTTLVHGSDGCHALCHPLTRDSRLLTGDVCLYASCLLSPNTDSLQILIQQRVLISAVCFLLLSAMTDQAYPEAGSLRDL